LRKPHCITSQSSHGTRLTALSELEETLKRFQTSHQVDFDFDLLRCTWDDVLRELDKAQAAVSESEAREKKPHRKAWRALGTTGGDIISSGLVALPDELGVLHGGLAIIFCVSLGSGG